MVLSSLEFMGLFALILGAWQLCRFAPRWRWAVLLGANIAFYLNGATPTLWWSLAASILLSYGLGLAMARTENTAARRALLAVGLVGLLGFLVAFKYLGFFTGGRYTLDLALPIGISFYTLQTLGYLIDVYRGKLPPETHLGYYAAYVSFFATITSGPVARAQSILPQLHKASRPGWKFDAEKASLGLLCFLFGLFEKCALADFIGSRITKFIQQPGTVLDTSLLVMCFLYSLQIYFDFAGYSNMALGVGRMLGLDLQQNFRQPYFATSIKDFWSRWHLSLSNWLRDYVYFPLGGSRRGTARTCINLMLTFLVSGLWHGAGLCYLIWGGLHGLYQIVGRLTKPTRSKLYAALHIPEDCLPVQLWRMVFTFVLVTFAWIFFSVGTVGGTPADVFDMLRRIAGCIPFTPRELLDGCALLDFHPAEAIRLAGLLGIAMIPDFFGRKTSPDEWLYHAPAPVRVLLCWLFVAGTIFFNTGVESFIYFAF